MREERIAAIVLVLLAAAYLVGSFFIPVPTIKQQLGPDAFPHVIGGLWLGLSLIYLVQQVRTKHIVLDEDRAAVIGADDKLDTFVDKRTVGVMLALMLVYALLFERLGYPITTFLVFTAGVLFLDRRHLVRDMIIAAIGSFGIFFIFYFLLRVQLPAGPLKFLLM